MAFNLNNVLPDPVTEIKHTLTNSGATIQTVVKTTSSLAVVTTYTSAAMDFNGDLIQHNTYEVPKFKEWTAS